MDIYQRLMTHDRIQEHFTHFMQMQDIGVLKLLIALGADINYEDDQPLRVAALNGFSNVARFLIDEGVRLDVKMTAEIFHTDGSSSTIHSNALSLAIDEGNDCIADMLYLAGMEPPW